MNVPWTVDINIKQLVRENADVAITYDNLSVVHKDLGDLQQAKQYHERALAICTKQLEANHINRYKIL